MGFVDDGPPILGFASLNKPTAKPCEIPCGDKFRLKGTGFSGVSSLNKDWLYDARDSTRYREMLTLKRRILKRGLPVFSADRSIVGGSAVRDAKELVASERRMIVDGCLFVEERFWPRARM